VKTGQAGVPEEPVIFIASVIIFPFHGESFCITVFFCKSTMTQV
jgi:hypothetical protein